MSCLHIYIKKNQSYIQTVKGKIQHFYFRLFPLAVDQPCSELKSKEGSALSSGVEAITVDPAVGPQSLRFCKGDTVCLLCCVRVEMWEVDLCLPSLTFYISQEKGMNIH